MTPIYLRHPRATTQALAMGALFVISAALTILGVLTYSGWLKLLALALAVPAAFFGYMCTRVSTLRVRLDSEGVWEPNPFRLTFVTPWSDISQIRKSLSDGRVRFLGVERVYKDGERRDIVALKLQAGAGGSEDAVAQWVETIRAAKATAQA